MSWEGWFTIAVTLSVLLVLTFTRVRPHIAMITAMTTLLATGILNGQQALAGFSNAGLITVAAMFIVAAGLHASGGVDILVKSLLGSPKSIRGSYLRMFTPVVFLSAFLNNTPVVATMVPGLLAWCKRININPSKIMIPLSYTAILGGTLTLIGTSTNLVLNGQYQSLTGEAGFSIFSITIIGLPVAICGLIFIWLFFPKWLPDIGKNHAFENVREFTLEVMVETDGVLVGQSVQQAGLRDQKSVYLVEIERNGTLLTAVPSEERLQSGDRLVFAGDTQGITDLLRIRGIVASTSDAESSVLASERPERSLVEAVVSPHCAAIGETIRDAMFLERYGAVIMAVARNGERIPGNLSNIVLQAGDTLLLEARPAFVSRQRYNKDFLLINDLGKESPNHDKAALAWVILITLVTAAGFGLIDMLHASLIGATLMILTGCCSVSQAERSLDLTVILTIAASFALGVALQQTGVADFVATGIVSLSQNQPWLMLVMTYIAVSVLTEVITNNAAAVLMLPIVLELTAKAGLHNEPFVFAIMMAASASFATPLGYQTNLMVYGPGGYHFRDFLKVGVPMNLFIGAVTLSVIMLIWPLN
ncbi:SLC13 family permease [Methylophaga muralis]|uniref:Sodium-dependent dicarboxylate transporter SdcS n=1 Tax=Methylophaga muralis TaxID=291169 RepID=A0A1E3GU40_9GAMM|nr:SLC13 family permease [Methylophaga muralis]ODN67588.1 Sodium-dependent dicarboxylate transporter SdcS [Methylophaga muralis]